MYYIFNRSPLVGHIFYFILFLRVRVKTTRFELKSQGQNISRLTTELPGRPVCVLFAYMFLLGNILRTDLQNRTRPLPWHGSLLLGYKTEPETHTKPNQRRTQNRTRDAHKTEPETHTKPNQRRTQNQPTGYYDQAPAMNWDPAVGWSRGVWVSVSDIGRVGLGWPTGIETIPSWLFTS